MRLLVTRPHDDSLDVAERLAVLGHECLIEPLLTIRPVPFRIPDEEISGTVFSSRNAVRAVADVGLVAKIASLPTYCVGDRTEQAAREADLDRTCSADGDRHALAALIAARHDPHAAPLWHPHGRHTREGLVEDLRQAGFSLIESVVYEAQGVSAFTAQAASALSSGRLDGGLFFSPRTARICANLIDACGTMPHRQAFTAFCLSQAVAEPLVRLGLSVRVATRPTLDALIALLSDETG